MPQKPSVFRTNHQVRQDESPPKGKEKERNWREEIGEGER